MARACTHPKEGVDALQDPDIYAAKGLHRRMRRLVRAAVRGYTVLDDGRVQLDRRALCERVHEQGCPQYVDARWIEAVDAWQRLLESLDAVVEGQERRLGS